MNQKSLREASSLEELVYKTIKDNITSGKVPPGSWIRQVEMAEELGVSQRTVREGLNRLVSEGFVVKEPYKGYRCCTLDLNTQKELYEIRAPLEGLAMEYAAACITPEDLEKMRSLLPFTIANEDPLSVEIAREKNREFHWIAIRSSGHEHLERILEQLWGLILTYFQVEQDPVALRVGSGMEDLNEHRMLIEALEKRDAQKAREIGSAHVLMTLASLQPRLRE